MIDQMNNLDVTSMIREIEFIRGATLRKIYRDGSCYIFTFYTSNGEVDLCLNVGKAFYITFKEHKKEIDNFTLFLRKHLLGKKLLDIYQYDSERVVVFDFGYKLIFEVFHRGNIILTDETFSILYTLKIEEWKDRTIKPKERYIFPKGKFDILKLNREKFFDIVLGSLKKDIIRCLILDLNLPKEYSNYILEKLNVDKSKKPQELSDEELNLIYNEIKTILNKIKNEISPCVYENFVLPIKIEGCKREFKLFSMAIEEFLEEKREEVKKEVKKEFKIDLNALKEKKEKMLKIAQTLENYRYTLTTILQKLLSLAKQYSWKEVIELVKKDTSWEASLIKEINYHDGYVIFEINNVQFKLSFHEDINELINFYYNKAKNIEKRIAQFSTQEISKEKKEIVEEEKKWYSKFRWFFTSSNLLFVAGKNAKQNELLAAKYLDKDDLVFHADIHGSPLGILKGKGSERDIREGAQFILCYSKAWSNNIVADVYYVSANQLKKYLHGYYVPFGSFIFEGKKNYIKGLNLEIGLGIKDDKLIIAPFLYFEGKDFDLLIKIIPGHLDKNNLAKEIRKILLSKGYDVKLDLLLKNLPNGGEIKVLKG